MKETQRITHSVEIAKTVQRRSRAVEGQLEKIIDRGLSGGRRQKGWSIEVVNKDWTTPKSVSGGEMRYHVKLAVVCVPKREKTPEMLQQEFDGIIKFIAKAGTQPGWEVLFIDGRVVTKDDQRTADAKVKVDYVPVEIPSNWKDSFNHIYERDAQIEIILSSLRAAQASNFQNRFHVALVGPPACGKTETLRAVKAVLGEEAVLEYDATATTQAGAIQDLNDRDELPRVLIVEEIEKTDPDSLRWLLSVMDTRAEIRKITARQQVQRETRMLTLATVNDYKLFKQIMYGALESRFAYHLYFPPPNRDLLQRILEREVAAMKGKKQWIKPTLDFVDSLDIHDPRKVTAICLCGRDDLLNGKYQKKLLACSTNIMDKKDREAKASSGNA